MPPKASARVYRAIIHTIKVPFTFSNFGGTVRSDAVIPANALILDAYTKIETGNEFDDVPTLQLGRTGSAALLLDTGNTDLTLAGVGGGICLVDWGGSDLPVLLTLAGTPTTGSGIVIVTWCFPDS